MGDVSAARRHRPNPDRPCRPFMVLLCKTICISLPQCCIALDGQEQTTESSRLCRAFRTDPEGSWRKPRLSRSRVGKRFSRTIRPAICPARRARWRADRGGGGAPGGRRVHSPYSQRHARSYCAVRWTLHLVSTRFITFRHAGVRSFCASVRTCGEAAGPEERVPVRTGCACRRCAWRRRRRAHAVSGTPSGPGACARGSAGRPTGVATWGGETTFHLRGVWRLRSPKPPLAASSAVRAGRRAGEQETDVPRGMEGLPPGGVRAAPE